MAVVAPPASQSNLLLAELLGANRSLIVSTIRPEEEVREWAASNGVNDGLTVDRIDPRELVTEPTTVTESIEPESFLLIDTVNPLETVTNEEYLTFLNDVKRALEMADSVGVLHCISHQTPPPRRTLTLTRADQIWELEVIATSRDIKTRLLVKKARKRPALTEPIPLKMTNKLEVDTSRSIS